MVRSQQQKKDRLLQLVLLCTLLSMRLKEKNPLMFCLTAAFLKSKPLWNRPIKTIAEEFGYL